MGIENRDLVHECCNVSPSTLNAREHQDRMKGEEEEGKTAGQNERRSGRWQIEKGE